MERLDNPNGFHPMMRQFWGMSDRLRAVLGHYNTFYKSSRGYTLWPYPNPGNAWDHEEPSIGRLNLQTENIVLQISNMEALQNAPREEQMFPTLEITPKGSNWNTYQNMVPGAENWIVSEEPPNQSTVSERQNFYNYVGADTPFTVAATEYGSLLDDGFIPTLGAPLGPPIEDYSCYIYSISGKKAQREAIGTSLAVEPHYNNYIASYENAIAENDVAETYLPNAYVMSAEFKNTSQSLLANWHYAALTLGDTVPYFSFTTGPGLSEQTSMEIYDLFAKAITGMDTANPQLLQFGAANNSTFVVLSSDENVLLGDYIPVSTIPFLNEIYIPQDPQERSGVQSQSSFFAAMADDPDLQGFIDMLQVMCINTLENYSPPAQSTGDYQVTTKHVLNSTDSSQYQRETAQNSYAYLANVLGELEAYISNENDPVAQASTALVTARNIIDAYPNPYVLPSLPPYRFIRDYGRAIGSEGEGFTGGLEGLIKIAPGTIENASVDIESRLTDFLRTYLEILAGTWAHTETLMYVVSKHEVNENGTDGALVQKFYLTNRFRTETLGRPITFYDSQVKYEKKYRYKIQKMVAIFGNAYNYGKEPGTPPLQLPAMLPVEVLNGGNIKVVLLPYTFGADPEDNGLESIIIDAPPVPPELSFHAHKGVSNRVRLLLNSSTGDYHMPPVAIQESDAAFFETEYASQEGASLSFAQIKEQKKTIHFRNDDPVDRYQVFRTTTPPASYEGFVDQERLSPELDPVYGTPASYMDTIEPNVKYYYCARSVDVHNNISNPTPIIEVEMVDNAGQIFLRQKPFVFETVKQPLTISGRKYILIEPAARQAQYESDSQPTQITVNDTPILPLGEADIADSVWNKKFKVRVVSKKTGRKIDLNLNFKNSGIVKGSE